MKPGEEKLIRDRFKVVYEDTMKSAEKVIRVRMENFIRENQIDMGGELTFHIDSEADLEFPQISKDADREYKIPSSATCPRCGSMAVLCLRGEPDPLYICTNTCCRLDFKP